LGQKPEKTRRKGGNKSSPGGKHHLAEVTLSDALLRGDILEGKGETYLGGSDLAIRTVGKTTGTGSPVNCGNRISVLLPERQE